MSLYFRVSQSVDHNYKCSPALIVLSPALTGVNTDQSWDQSPSLGFVSLEKYMTKININKRAKTKFKKQQEEKNKANIYKLAFNTKNNIFYCNYLFRKFKSSVYYFASFEALFTDHILA